ncbi:MAG: 3-phosphoshikimate 1-carboxyvinyltransferase [Natronomonas sp.]
MDVTVSPSALRGTTRAPPSKSYTHRAILAAGYGEGAVVSDPLQSADTRATARAVAGYGGACEWNDGTITVEGFGGDPETPSDVLDCENSGTTMRLTTATGALVDGLAVLSGDDSLRSRPQGPLLSALEDLGARAESTRENGQAPLVVGGGIDGESVAIRGDVSSQYITALLMAGAVTESGLEVELTTELKSAPYVDITLEVLADFGVETTVLGGEGTEGIRSAGADGFRVPGGQTYDAGDGYAVPGDFSSMSYLLAAGALVGDGVTVAGARPSAQGDAAIVDILDEMGADIEWGRTEGVVTVEGSELEGITVGVADTPDLLPTIAAVGAVADGTTRITDCAHVRLKETDRVAAMASELERMGAVVTERDDELVIDGGETELHGATVDGHHDHRIVMALSVAGLAADGETTIEGAEHVDVSFPDFFETMAELGATVVTE